MKNNKILIFIIILTSFGMGLYFYPQMPAKMASHWNASGQVDGYVSKLWGLFLMPFLSLGMFLLFLWLLKIDPLKENVRQFKKYFDGFILLMMVFLFYLYVLTIAWNLGLRFSFNRWLIPAFGSLFFFIGILLAKTKQNWFVGIRTPWTLSSEIVWEKTHRLGAKLFKLSGIIAFLGIFFEKIAIYLTLIPIILASLFLFVYSYFEYKKTNRD